MKCNRNGGIYKELEDLHTLDFEADYVETPEYLHDSYYDMNTDIATVDRIDSLIHSSGYMDLIGSL